jgi:hypothetical protein
MGCINHPERDAVKICSACQAKLCDSCGTSLENHRILCHRCMLAVSAQEGKTEAKERDLREEARRAGLERKWRPSYVQTLLTVGGVLVIVMLGLRFYWGQDPSPPPQIHLSPGEPLELLANVQLALERYAVAHEEHYPSTLHDLFPDFLADTPENRRLLGTVAYELDKSSGYWSRVKADGSGSGQGLVATEEGIQPSREGSGS